MGELGHNITMTNLCLFTFVVSKAVQKGDLFRNACKFVMYFHIHLFIPLKYFENQKDCNTEAGSGG